MAYTIAWNIAISFVTSYLARANTVFSIFNFLDLKLFFPFGNIDCLK